MPSKSQRAASRQAQLRRRRRRTKGRPQEFDAGPVQRESAAGPDSPDRADIPATPQASVPGRGVVGMRQSRAGISRDGGPRSGYLGAELRQIGIITTLIFAILAVLTVFLR